MSMYRNHEDYYNTFLDLEKKKVNAINKLRKTPLGGEGPSKNSEIKSDRPVVSPALLKELKILKSKMSDVVVSMNTVINLLECDDVHVGTSATTSDAGTATTTTTNSDVETMTDTLASCEQGTSSTDTWDLSFEQPDRDGQRTIGCNTPLSTKPLMTPPSYGTLRSSEANRRRRSIVGTGPRNLNISALSNVRELFVSSLHPTTSTREIVSYIRSKAEIEHISQISHPDAMAKSFLLVVPAYEFENVMCPEFWPSGVRCREFVRPVGGRWAWSPG